MAKPPSIAFLLLPRFTLTPFSLLSDTVRLAADEGDRSRPRRLSWTVLSPGGEPVVASSGLRVAVDGAARGPVDHSHLVVCGGLLAPAPAEDPRLEEWVARAHAGGCVVVGLCTGTFLMARAGLLAGRSACVSWFHLAEFQRKHPDVRAGATRRFVADGDLVTCAGGAGAADVGAWMVEDLLGPAIARKALDILMVDPRDQLQPRPALAGDLRDPRVREAVLLMEERLDHRRSVADLAAAVGVSARQLERLFHAETGLGPAGFASRLRLAHADWLIRTTDRALTDIALACGFADLSHLSRRYAATFGAPPSTLRGQHGFMPGEHRPYATGWDGR